MNQDPNKLRQKAEQARENDKLEKSLTLTNQAIIIAQKQKKYEVIVDALKAKVLTWKHLYLLNNDKTFSLLAQKSAEAALEITKTHKLDSKLHSTYFRLGEVAMLDKNFSQAIHYYQKALNVYQGPLSEKGDYRYHLGEALYKSGKKQKGLSTIKQGIKEIKDGKDEINDFLFNVWLSGAHMRLTELLQADNPENAKKHARKAQEIIKKDNRLIIRKRQLKQLLKTTSIKL